MLLFLSSYSPFIGVLSLSLAFSFAPNKPPFLYSLLLFIA